jgi:uncharacterized protein YkwD
MRFFALAIIAMLLASMWFVWKSGRRGPPQPSPQPLDPAAMTPHPPAPATRVEAPPPAPVGTTRPEVEEKIFLLVNQERAQAGLRALSPEDTLRQTAREHNQDMLARRFFDHINPSGDTPAERIARRHRRLVGLTGENIWEGAGQTLVESPQVAERIVRDWMGSPGHRENILRPSFTHLGAGVTVWGDEMRATQNFAEVKALLETPVMERISSGTALQLRFGAGQPIPEKLDLWDEHARRSAFGPAPTAEPVTALPGSYRLRFYFSGAGAYDIYPGPEIRVQ